MTIRVTIQAELKENVYREFKEFLEENLPNVRGFPGALSVSILASTQSNDFMIYEEWQSEDHHKDNIHAITQNGVMGHLASFFKDMPAIKYYSKEAI